MNTPGTIYATGKMIAATEDTGINNAWRKIRAVWHDCKRFTRKRRSKITIKEYAEYYGYELNEFVDQINTKCKMKIQPDTFTAKQ
jgi:hypothetical protein